MPKKVSNSSKTKKPSDTPGKSVISYDNNQMKVGASAKKQPIPKQNLVK